jgi:hypothetical protein
MQRASDCLRHLARRAVLAGECDEYRLPVT